MGVALGERIDCKKVFLSIALPIHSYIECVEQESSGQARPGRIVDPLNEDIHVPWWTRSMVTFNTLPSAVLLNGDVC